MSSRISISRGRWAALVSALLLGSALGGCASADTGGVEDEAAAEHETAALRSVGCLDSEWMACGDCVGGDCVGCLERWSHQCQSEPYPQGSGGGYLPGDVGTRPSSSTSCIAPACKSACLATRRTCLRSCAGDQGCASECGTIADCTDFCCH